MKFYNGILCAFAESFILYLSIRNTNSAYEDALLGIVNDDMLDGLCVSLGRRALEGPRCMVDTLRIVCGVDRHRMRHHVDRIIALADACKIDITVPCVGRKWREVWTLVLPPLACHLDIALFDHSASALTRPGAPTLW
jgi:hypothetical protein